MIELVLDDFKVFGFSLVDMVYYSFYSRIQSDFYTFYDIKKLYERVVDFHSISTAVCSGHGRSRIRSSWCAPLILITLLLSPKRMQQEMV